MNATDAKSYADERIATQQLMPWYTTAGIIINSKIVI